MEEQNRFLEMLQEIKLIAAAQQNKLTKDEIKKYLGEEGLSEEKLQAVYHYLGENHIAVEGYEYIPLPSAWKASSPVEKTGDVPETEKGRKERQEAGSKAGQQGAKKAVKENGRKPEISRREVNMKLYRREIAQYSGKLEEDKELILTFLRGDDTVKGSIIENYLQKVVVIAEKYQKRNVPVDEIIAEGNVGLMVAMQIIGQNREEYILANGELDFEKFFGTLDLEISHAMETYIDDMTASKDWENAMLARTNLLHEATKYMAEEIGRVPTIDELSEYTKISREEIKDIMGLSEDARRVAAPE